MDVGMRMVAERERGGVDFILRRAAELAPGRIAVDDRLSGVRWTYAQLLARASQLARALESLGLSKGDVVATALRNESPAIEAVFACALAGLVVAPLNVRMSSLEAHEFLAKQQARVLICHHGLTNFGNGGTVNHVVVCGAPVSPSSGTDYESFIAPFSTQPPPPRSTWTDPVMIGMTGGTTGGSKGALVSHVSCLLDILSSISHLGLRPGYKALCTAPVYHLAGLNWACLAVLWQVGTVVFPAMQSFDGKAFLTTVADEAVDCFFLIPAMVGPLYQAWDRQPLRGVKAVALASAPVPRASRVKVAEMFPNAHKVVAYGMTECLSISMQRPEDFVEHGEGVGEPVLTARMRVVDDDGRAIPAGSTGHVVARTFGQAIRYNHNSQATASTFHVLPDDPEELEWVHTGDVGFVDDQGRLTLLDRAKDVIISGGENVPSSEVESVLAQHDGVTECAVIGIADDKWGEVVCAVVVSAQPDRALDPHLAAELHAMCREQLAAFKVPKRFTFVERLPRSAFGKVLKRELRNKTFETWIEASSLPRSLNIDSGDKK